MSLLLGKVLGNMSLRQTIRVAIPKLKFDDFLTQHFRESDEFLAHDPDEKCKPDDWVLIKELDESLSLKVKHALVKVVYKSGNIIDPLTGKKVIGMHYEEDIARQGELFGMKPLTKRELKDSDTHKH
jgi:small subunit ribosomal protein S17